tara:strand:- start:1992 stop:2981 length:990 start_codon:yes stop_codon:yes gene_type:complete
MIYLEFLKGQGLGNQLWNYVTLRSISNKLGFGYEIINPENFKGSSFLEISYKGYANLENSQDCILDNNERNIFKEKLFYDKVFNSYSSDFDKEILKIKPNTIIKGLFQSESYLFKNDIKKFIKLKKFEENNFNILENTCILNIRGGEYKRFKKLILPKSYWLNAIVNMRKIKQNINFRIVTDDYDYAKQLLPEVEILKGKINDDFCNLFYADYLIVSNSSFSYFPITLGEKPKKIIAPSKWSRFGNDHDKWISPANYYKGWSYQNEKGEIISSNEIRKLIKETRRVYSSYNILTTEESINRKPQYSFIPSKFKKIIKKILAKLFPLHIG